MPRPKLNKSFVSTPPTVLERKLRLLRAEISDLEVKIDVAEPPIKDRTARFAPLFALARYY